MKPLILQRKKDGNDECVHFFEYYYSHRTEGDREVGSIQKDYDKTGYTRDELIKKYKKDGYTELSEVRSGT